MIGHSYHIPPHQTRRCSTVSIATWCCWSCCHLCSLSRRRRSVALGYNVALCHPPHVRAPCHSRPGSLVMITPPRFRARRTRMRRPRRRARPQPTAARRPRAWLRARQPLLLPRSSFRSCAFAQRGREGRHRRTAGEDPRQAKKRCGRRAGDDAKASRLEKSLNERGRLVCRCGGEW